MAFPTAQQIMAAAPKSGLQQLGELLQAGTQGYLQGQQIGQARDDRQMQLADRQAQKQAAQSQAKKEAQAANLFRQAVNSDNPQEQEQLVAQASLLAPDLISKALGSRGSFREQQQSQMEKMIEQRKAQIESELKDEETTFKRAEKLRGEYNKLSKDYFDVEAAYDRVKASVEEPDAAGDIALIFNYMKMLDPGSVVREGEFATAENAGGVDESIRNMYNKIASGERLQPKQREMFRARAERLFNTAQQRNNRVKSEILSIGDRYNLNADDIFGTQKKESAPQETQEPVDWSEL